VNKSDNSIASKYPVLVILFQLNKRWLFPSWWAQSQNILMVAPNYLDPLYTLGRFPIGRGINCDFFNFWAIKGVQNTPHVLVNLKAFQLCRFTTKWN